MRPCRRRRTSRNRAVPRNATAPNSIVAPFLSRPLGAVKSGSVYDPESGGGDVGTGAPRDGAGSGTREWPRSLPFQNEPVVLAFLRLFFPEAVVTKTSSQAWWSLPSYSWWGRVKSPESAKSEGLVPSTPALALMSRPSFL